MMNLIKCSAKAMSLCPDVKACCSQRHPAEFVKGSECDRFNEEVELLYTNADHIRSMTDEELCDFIVFHTGYRESAWSETTYYNFLTGGDDTRARADADTLKWLKQPYKEKKE